MLAVSDLYNNSHTLFSFATTWRICARTYWNPPGRHLEGLLKLGVVVGAKTPTQSPEKLALFKKKIHSRTLKCGELCNRTAFNAIRKGIPPSSICRY